MARSNTILMHILLFLSIFPAFVLASSAIYISTNSSEYTLNSIAVSVNFLPGTSNSTLFCTQSGYIKGMLVFANNTYNNTIENCTIDGTVLSMHNAQNNLINSSGKYSMLFLDNFSNIGIGSIFRFRAYSSKNFTTGSFLQIFPDALFKTLQMSYDGFTKQHILSDARIINYQLPRFGIYPNQSSNGKSNFVVEGEQVYKNRSINFNPYVIMTPYLGDDVLMISHFNATLGGALYPTWISPQTPSYAILPANKPVFRNFSIIFHNYTKWSKITLLNGWQSDPNSTLDAVYNITKNGTLSYFSGIQNPGYYEYILVLNTSYETENSTTTTYSVGLSYCSDYGSEITQPGYYPLAYNTLNELNVFWRTNNTCEISVNVHSSNATINCKGGYLKSKQVDIMLDQVNNVTVENCTLYGDGMKSVGSKSVMLTHDTFTANASGEYAIYSYNSNITINSSKFSGYQNPIFLSNSTIIYGQSQNISYIQSGEYIVFLILLAYACIMLYYNHKKSIYLNK